MTDDSARSDALADVINLVAAPIANGIRTVEQFRRGADELFRAVENLNRTMENLNETAERVNRLLGELEAPIRAMIPQLTRTVAAADEITKRLEGPVRSAAPNIERMVDTLSSPGFASLPHQLGEFMQTIGDVSRRLAPLTQFAENAGGLLGGLKLPGIPGRPSGPPASRPTPTVSHGTGSSSDVPGRGGVPRAATPATKSAAKRSPAKKSTATRPTATKSAAKRSPAKKSAAKRSPAKRSTKSSG